MKQKPIRVMFLTNWRQWGISIFIEVNPRGRFFDRVYAGASLGPFGVRVAVKDWAASK